MERKTEFDVLFKGHMDTTLSPEEVLQFDVLQSVYKTPDKTADISETLRDRLWRLLDQKIGDPFRSDEEVNAKQKDRHHQRLLMWASKLRQETTGTNLLFPKLSLIRQAAADIQSAPEGMDVPVAIFMAMDEALERHFRQHQPWWHKAAGLNIAKLRQFIIQYEDVRSSDSDNSYSLAMRLAQEYDETARSFLRCSQMDLIN